MTTLLPTLVVAFAAFCVWLTVRIVNRREQWAKWTLASALGLPVLYVLSFGPACWLAWHLRPVDGVRVPLRVVAAIYRPLVSLGTDGPQFISAPLRGYAQTFPEGENGRHLMAVILGIESLPTPTF